MAAISIWNYEIPIAWLSQSEVDYLSRLPAEVPPVEWVWKEIDRIWWDNKLNNKVPLEKQPIRRFYSHPVWLMNGIFTQVDPVSAGHRLAIANYLDRAGMRNIADFGGGFGSLALSISHTVADARIDIIEPYPSNTAIERVKYESRVNFMANLGECNYDAVVAQDVLEHVEDPVSLAVQLASAVRVGGIVIFANCFYPVIHCHLPSTFHLRHTFSRVMGAIGLRYLGVVEGAEHALVFKRCGPISLKRARLAEKSSRLIGPILNVAIAAVSQVRRLVV